MHQNARMPEYYAVGTRPKHIGVSLRQGAPKALEIDAPDGAGRKVVFVLTESQATALRDALDGAPWLAVDVPAYGGAKLTTFSTVPLDAYSRLRVSRGLTTPADVVLVERVGGPPARFTLPAADCRPLELAIGICLRNG